MPETAKSSANKKTAKTAFAKKTAAKKTMTKKRGPKKTTTWIHTTLVDLEAFRAKFSSEGKCAKAIGVSLGGLRSWLGSGKAKTKQVPSVGSQEKIKAAIERGPSPNAMKRNKRGPKPKAKAASATASEPKTKRSSRSRPSEGVSLLAMAMVEEDWDLVKEAYLLLR